MSVCGFVAGSALLSNVFAVVHGEIPGLQWDFAPTARIMTARFSNGGC
jgi:hypothetical protein